MSRISEALASLWFGAQNLRSDGLQPSQKGTATGPLIAYQNLGEPVWAPRDYSAFAREGFMQNAILYRSVRMIAEAAATIPLL
ncbi:MAG: phage portal protein, partial [Hyphomicrobium sp.]|nr:phage portal protein [Hyphomicrobium sp.]